jgi:hypothetical protein
MTTWLAGSIVVLALICLAILFSCAGSIIRSFVATTYHVGLIRHAASHCRLRLEERAGGLQLRRNQFGLFRRRQILSEVIFDALLRKQKEPARLRLYLIQSRRLGEGAADVTNGLSGVWCKRREVDQADHFWVVAGLGDHHTAIRMADKNRRAVLGRERPLRGCHVVGERGQWIADRGDPKAFCLQERCDLRPARVISKCTMHQHNVLRCEPRRTLCHGPLSEETRSQSDAGKTRFQAPRLRVGHTVTTSQGACRAARATSSRSRLPVGVRASTAPGFAAACQAT